MLDTINILTLAILGYIDFKIYKIPNVVLTGWLITILVKSYLCSTPIMSSTVVVSLLVAGSFYPLRRIVKCNAGDFKLFALLTLAKGPSDSLAICFLSMIISLIPLVSGVKKVPLALMTFFGYIAFFIK